MKSVRDFLKENNIPIAVTFELTLRCNCHCAHCYQQYLERVPELALEEWVEVIDKIYQAGTFSLTLTGGEPLLYPNFLQLLQSPKLANFRVAIISNGSLWNSEIIQAVKSLPFAEVQISLYSADMKVHDSCTGVEGSFIKTVDTIQKLKDERVNVKVFCFLLPENIEKVSDLKFHCDQMGVHLSTSTRFFPPFGGNKKECYLSSETLRRYLAANGANEYFLNSPVSGDPYYPCAAGQTGFTISPDGKCFPCEMTRTPFASIREDDFLEQWQRHPMLTRIRSLKGVTHVPEKCRKCEKRLICKRCPALFKAINDDDLSPPDVFCNIIHNFSTKI